MLTNKAEFTERRKNLIMELADGYPMAFRFIHILEIAKKREEVYVYFIKRGITGRQFVQYVLDRGGSPMRVLKEVLSQIENKKKEDIIVGRDIV